MAGEVRLVREGGRVPRARGVHYFGQGGGELLDTGGFCCCGHMKVQKAHSTVLL